MFRVKAETFTMNETIKSFFKENGVQISLQVATVFVFLLNLFLTTKLAPLAQNIDSVITRVNAIEERLPGLSQDHTDIAVIKEQVLQIKEDTKDIKQSLDLIRRLNF